MKQCVRCGAENSSHQYACWRCYARLPDSRSLAAAPPAPAAVARPAFRTVLRWAAVLALTAAALAGWFVTSSRPTAVASRYFEACKAADVEEMRRYVTSDSQDRLDEWAKVRETMSTRGLDPFMPKLRSFHAGACRIAGSKAVITATTVWSYFDDESGKERTLRLPHRCILRKEEGRWRVDLAATNRSLLAAFRSVLWPTREGTGKR